MVVIMLPKLLALIDLANDWPRRRAFGGLARATVGVVGETIFSTLHAPLLMLWHTRFVVTNLLGISVGWAPQKRAADGTTWLFALRRHWGHTLIGLVWGAFMWWLDPIAVLVVHAGAGGHGAVHSVERADQPAQPRRARAQARTVSDAGGNRAAAGTGFAALAHENP